MGLPGEDMGPGVVRPAWAVPTVPDGDTLFPTVMLRSEVKALLRVLEREYLPPSEAYEPLHRLVNRLQRVEGQVQAWAGSST